MPNYALKALAQNTTFAGIQYHDLNGCRNIIQAYIENNYLDKESDVQGAPVLKGGLVRLDPQLYAILNPKPSSQTHTIRKDAIFKSLTSCTNPAYVISEVDPNQAQSAQEASSFTLHQASSTFNHGQVPKVKIEALKFRNRKITRTTGLELHQIDIQEFSRHLRNKCQSAVTNSELPQSAKSGGGPQKIMREVVIQGNMIKAIEESLTQRYKVAAKYIESVNKLPEKKKKQQH